MRVNKTAGVLAGLLGLALLGTAMPASAEPVATAAAGITAADIAQPELATDASATEYSAIESSAADDVTVQQTAAGAVQWFRSRNGSTAYQGYCERAVRLAWDRQTHHASAIEHWNSSDGVKHRTGTPPMGAFVFWNISSYGHVGIADGNGGFWATSVNGRIGHASSTSYFRNYLGWKPGNSN